MLIAITTLQTEAEHQASKRLYRFCTNKRDFEPQIAKHHWRRELVNTITAHVDRLVAQGTEYIPPLNTSHLEAHYNISKGKQEPIELFTWLKECQDDDAYKVCPISYSVFSPY